MHIKNLKIIGELKLHLALFISVLFFYSCGGVQNQTSGTDLNPELFLSGEYTGNTLVRDRNQNVKKTYTIQRTCKKEGELKGFCTDRVFEENRLVFTFHNDYQITYGEDLQLFLVIKDERGQIQGKKFGRALFLEGKRNPLFTTESLAAESLWNAYNSEQNMYIQRDTFYYAGIVMGYEETVWQMKIR